MPAGILALSTPAMLAGISYATLRVRAGKEGEILACLLAFLIRMAIAQDGMQMRALLVNAIESEVKNRAGLLYEKKKKEFVEAFDREKDAVVAGVVLNIMDMVDFEQMANRIVLTIRKVEAPKI